VLDLPINSFILLWKYEYTGDCNNCWKKRINNSNSIGKR
jgi:hypothetical protein